MRAFVALRAVTDRAAQWATGLWHGDPLGREREWSEPSPNRMLWGAGDHWDSAGTAARGLPICGGR